MPCQLNYQSIVRHYSAMNKAEDVSLAALGYYYTLLIRHYDPASTSELA
jgi:hypothetical protein